MFKKNLPCQHKLGKVALIGGGSLANEFFVVNLKSIENEDGAKVANLETANCRLPNPFRPYLGSWQIAELAQEFKDLPLGHYYILGDKIADAESGGIFSTVDQLKTVKVLAHDHGSALGGPAPSREVSDGPS